MAAIAPDATALARTGDPGDRDRGDGAFDLDPRDRGRDHGRPWLHSIAGINLLSSRNKKLIFLSLI